MNRPVRDPDESPGFLLWRVTLRWQREVVAALEPLSLTHVQFVLLASVWWLNERGEHPNQLAVARHAGTDVKMASQVLRKLEHSGLVEREVDPGDTRARRLRVTSSGGALARRAVTVVEAADDRFFSRLPRRDATALTDSLRALS